MEGSHALLSVLMRKSCYQEGKIRYLVHSTSITGKNGRKYTMSLTRFFYRNLFHQALMIWNVNSSPPVLSKSFSHCHGDWITGCAWTSTAVVRKPFEKGSQFISVTSDCVSVTKCKTSLTPQLSCSSDCKLRMWNIQTGSLLREILSSSSLSTLCCWVRQLHLKSMSQKYTISGTC